MFIYKPGDGPAAAEREDAALRRTKVLDPAKAIRHYHLATYRAQAAYWFFFLLFGLYNIVGDDLRHLLLPVGADVYAYIFTGVCVLFFAVDIAFSLAANPAYRRSLLLWLDAVSTLAMVFDWGVVSSRVFNYRNKTTYAKLARAARLATLGRIFAQGALLARAGAEVGWRAGVRAALRGARGRRTPRGYRSLQGRAGEAAGFRSQEAAAQWKAELREFNPGAAPAAPRPPPAPPGPARAPAADTTEGLLRSTANRLIVVVLLVVFTIPLFRYSTFWAEPAAFQSAAVAVATRIDAGGDGEALRPQLDALAAASQTPLLFAGTRRDGNYRPLAATGYASPAQIAAAHRPYELISVAWPLSDARVAVVLIFDNTDDADSNAVLNIVRAAVVVLIILCFAVAHSLQIFSLLAPLRRMTRQIERMADNPLVAAEPPAGAEEGARERRPRFEPELISRVLADTSRLLALGLGGAASRFVAAHLRSRARPPAPALVTAVFGFIVLRDFARLSEALGPGLCGYLNTIAFIVHCAVDRFGGEVNKNIGEAVLVVFRSGAADAAVLCMAEVLVEVARLKVAPEPAVAAGLHAGWAVEGAIGTAQKLDFSYLSPTVNLAARIASATQQFGARLLFSDAVAEGLSAELRGLARRVDRVTLKGSATPLDLYALDLDLGMVDRVMRVAPSQREFALRRAANQRAREKSGSPAALMGAIDGFDRCRARYTPLFFELWAVGMAYYSAGNFAAARKKFAEARRQVGSDGPADTLTRFIDGMSPADCEAWSGVRRLAAK